MPCCKILNLLLLLDLYCCVVSGSSKCLSHWLHGMVVQVFNSYGYEFTLPPFPPHSPPPPPPTHTHTFWSHNKSTVWIEWTVSIYQVTPVTVFSSFTPFNNPTSSSRGLEIYAIPNFRPVSLSHPCQSLWPWLPLPGQGLKERQGRLPVPEKGSDLDWSFKKWIRLIQSTDTVAFELVEEVGYECDKINSEFIWNKSCLLTLHINY